MLNAASRGQLANVQQLLDRGCPVDVCDYDKRTGLMLAAVNGHEVRCTDVQNPTRAQHHASSGWLLWVVATGSSFALVSVFITCASITIPASYCANSPLTVHTMDGWLW